MTSDNRIVYVVMHNDSKDLSDARRYGQLRAVFLNPRKPYDPERLIETARIALADWRDGDHLLMIGDPVLCAVCMTVLSEEHSAVRTLSWDRLHLQYVSHCWDFDAALSLNNPEAAD